jgi:hypothetical protein
MEVMGIEAVYPKPKLSLPGEGHKIYPYLLQDQLRSKWDFKGYVVSDCGAVIDIYRGHHYEPRRRIILYWITLHDQG